MTYHEPWQLKLAWQLAWQERGCPPERLMAALRDEQSFEEHLEACPFCHERLAHDLEDEPLQPLVEALNRGAGPPGTTGDTWPVPGQIWSIKASLGGWGPMRRYYNPPLVLAVAPAPPGEHALAVVQLYHDRLLSGPGDVELGDELFAETWNGYTLARDDLECYWGEVDDELLRQVTAQAAEPPVSMDDEEFSPRMAFRRLEIEVGAFFASQSVGRLMARLQPSPAMRIRELYPDPAPLLRHLRERQPSLIAPGEPHAPLECLALMRFPIHELPMAAAEQQQLIALNRARLVGEQLIMEAASAAVTLWRLSPESLLIGGRIVHSLPADAELRAWLKGVEGQLLPASEIDFAPANGFFRLWFPGSFPGDWTAERLVLLVCEGVSRAAQVAAP